MHTHTYAYGLKKHPEPSTPPDAAATPTDARDSREAARWDESRDLAATLARVEAAREEQLSSISETTDDLVVIAYRDAVRRILDEIRTARARLDEGSYGLCVSCHGRVGADRLEALPWATQCTLCATRRYH